MTDSAPRPIGYWALLRDNRQVRFLWLAQVVSDIGDRLSLVAILLLVERLSGSAQAAGLVLILQMLPLMIWSPIAGHLADRFDRRHLMIVADLVRAVIVLGFLLIDDPSELWLVWILVGLQFSLTAVFQPARSALLPNLAAEDELVTANALAAVTWSGALAAGAMLGGIVVDLFGSQVAYVVDSATFLVSAILLGRLTAPSPGPDDEHGPGSSVGLVGVVRIVLRRRRLLAGLMIKVLVAVSGGAIWLLTVTFGQRVFPIGDDAAISVGLFYGAQGFGALLGASLARRLVSFVDENSSVRSVIVALGIRALAFVALGFAPSIGLALAAVVGAATGGSLMWVSSMTLLQRLAPDRIRGRVFALDWAAFTLAVSIVIHFTGQAMDSWNLTPQTVAFACTGIGLLLATGWLGVVLSWSNWTRQEEPDPTRA